MGDRRVSYTVAAPGEHWVANALAVLAAVARWAAILALPGWRWPKWADWPDAARS